MHMSLHLPPPLFKFLSAGRIVPSMVYVHVDPFRVSAQKPGPRSSWGAELLKICSTVEDCFEVTVKEDNKIRGIERKQVDGILFCIVNQILEIQ